MTNTRVKKLTSIIAEEIGCPSWIEGENPSFSYCCDRDKVIVRGLAVDPSGGLNSYVGSIEKRGCHCERAALRSLEELSEPLLQP